MAGYVTGTGPQDGATAAGGRSCCLALAYAPAEQKLGPIDLFFSNAGVATGSDPLTTPIATWNDQWQINL